MKLRKKSLIADLRKINAISVIVKMAKFYGYRGYNSSGQPLGWLYLTNAGCEYVYTNKPDYLGWCKRWKTPKGAAKNFDWYNQQWKLRYGGYLKIEIMPDFVEEPKDKYWDEANSDIIKESKAKYDRKKPTWSFRPKPELVKWLENVRLPGETDAALLNRQLEKLMRLEHSANTR
jgi:hypothetical protein